LNDNLNDFICDSDFKYPDRVKLLLESFDIIYINDLKYFLKFLIRNNVINIFNEDHILDKLHEHVLLDHLNSPARTHLTLSDIADDSNLHDLEHRYSIFQQLYNYYRDDYTPRLFLNDLVSAEANVMRKIGRRYVDVESSSYYLMLKKCIYYLSKCELNGIKVYDKNIIKNVNNFVYPIYQCNSSQTGRLTNNYPANLQNLAKDSVIRTNFIPRYDYFLTCDFNSFDLRVLFALAGEKINADDLHTFIAKSVFDKEEITLIERKKIKNINFGVFYSASIETIAENTDIDIDEVKQLLGLLNTKFNKLSNFIKIKQKEVVESGIAVSYWGRKRYLKREEITKHISSVVQMTSADITYRSIYYIQRKLEAKNLKSLLLPYIVYDKFVFDAVESEIDELKRVVTTATCDEAVADLKNNVNFLIDLEITKNI
jgi:DNA polymerase I-like protein with 3'-5' exonuclease and polymerase domains